MPPSRPDIGAALLATFDRVYVVNLAARTDRLRETEGQLRLVGLSFDHDRVERFDAVRPDDPGGFPTVGARGCFLSHLGVLERAADRGEESVLLLEDDVDWSPALLHAPDASLDGAWDLIHGGSADPSRSRAAPALRDVAADAPLLHAHFVGFRNGTVPRLRDHLRAILARPPGDPEGGPMHVDGAYSWFRAAHPEIRTATVTPPLARQRASRTDIHDQGAWRAWPGVARGLALGRRLRNRLAR